MGELRGEDQWSVVQTEITPRVTINPQKPWELHGGKTSKFLHILAMAALSLSLPFLDIYELSQIVWLSSKELPQFSG